MPPSNTETPALIDLIGEDLLQNIVSKLPATSFSSAACVSHSWNLVCNRILSRPKLSSACSINHSLQAAVEEVVNKILSEPIRPHFAIASIGGYYEDGLDVAHQLITAALGSKVQVITNRPIKRDGYSDDDELKETKKDSILLIVGFLPGLKVATIPLLERFQIDKFVTDIREFSTSVSGCNSPAAVIVFNDICLRMLAIMENMDSAMSPETVIVGDTLSWFRCTNEAEGGSSEAVALVFAVDRNKPPGIGETQFHAVLSSGLSPVGPTYKATSVIQKDTSFWISARREGSLENISGETILNQLYDETGDQIPNRELCIGQEKVGCMTSLSLHGVCGSVKGRFFVCGSGLKTGDTFRFFHPDSTIAPSSAAAVSSHLRSFIQGSKSTTSGDKLEVFGGLIFSCPDIFGKWQTRH